jgi:hypothetical protein
VEAAVSRRKRKSSLSSRLKMSSAPAVRLKTPIAASLKRNVSWVLAPGCARHAPVHEKAVMPAHGVYDRPSGGRRWRGIVFDNEGLKPIFKRRHRFRPQHTLEKLTGIVGTEGHGWRPCPRKVRQVLLDGGFPGESSIFKPLVVTRRLGLVVVILRAVRVPLDKEFEPGGRVEGACLWISIAHSGQSGPASRE